MRASRKGFWMTPNQTRHDIAAAREIIEQRKYELSTGISSFTQWIAHRRLCVLAWILWVAEISTRRNIPYAVFTRNQDSHPSAGRVQEY